MGVTVAVPVQAPKQATFTFVVVAVSTAGVLKLTILPVAVPFTFTPATRK